MSSKLDIFTPLSLGETENKQSITSVLGQVVINVRKKNKAEGRDREWMEVGRRVIIWYKVIREISDRYPLSKVPKEEERATGSYGGTERPSRGNSKCMVLGQESLRSSKEACGLEQWEKELWEVRAEDEGGQITSSLVCMVGVQDFRWEASTGLSRGLTWPQSTFQKIPLTEE